MLGCHAATVTRCDSRADFGACPCCGYSAAGSISASTPAVAIVQQQGALLVPAPAARSHMGEQQITLHQPYLLGGLRLCSAARTGS